ncbi:MAG: hypothetical protein ACSLEZ_12865 [Thiobacillus sp.]
MTGQDLIFWLEDLFYDLTNPATANLPWLGIRLALLAVGVAVTYSLGRQLLGSVWRGIVSPVLRGLWRIVSAPVRIPARQVRRLRQRMATRRAIRLREAETRAQLAREARERAAVAEQVAAIRQTLDDL